MIHIQLLTIFDTYDVLNSNVELMIGVSIDNTWVCQRKEDEMNADDYTDDFV